MRRAKPVGPHLIAMAVASPMQWSGCANRRRQSSRPLRRPLLRDRGFADSSLEGDGFEPSVPRVMDGDLGRAVPALIAVFELAGTAVALQRGTKGGLAAPSSRIPVKDS